MQCRYLAGAELDEIDEQQNDDDDDEEDLDDPNTPESKDGMDQMSEAEKKITEFRSKVVVRLSSVSSPSSPPKWANSAPKPKQTSCSPTQQDQQQESSVFRCSECTKVCKSAGGLKLHMKKHG